MKYCEEILTQIKNNLELGLGRVDTCHDVGISYETFSKWMDGELPEVIFVGMKTPEEIAEKKKEFYNLVQKSETVCKKKCIEIIKKASITTWQAAAWFLERKYKDEFGQNKFILGGDKNNPLVVKFSAVDEQL
jgi:hypothetical protein